MTTRTTRTSRVTIHVGLHKAASTYLQERFFPDLQDVWFVHATHRRELEENAVQSFIGELLFRNPVVLDVDAHRRAIEDELRAREVRHLIISAEALFGWPFDNHMGFRSNADLLAAAFPQASIWMVLRRQDQWIESAYSQVLKMGLSTTPERFTNWERGAFGSYKTSIYEGPNLDVNDLDWSRYVEYYQSLFGPERVLAQPFEWFVEDKAAFLGAFCRFAGVAPFVPPDDEKVNIAYSPVSAFVARTVNRIPMGIKLALKRRIDPSWHPAAILNRTLDARWKRRGRLVDPRLRSAALALHVDNNRRLVELGGPEFERFGYCG